MAHTNQMKVFAVGNGDTVLIEAHGRRILTDVKYREDPDDDAPDIAEPIRAACSDNHLDLFVLTHDDDDHLLGFTTLFHTGPPGDHVANPASGVPLIIVDEMWCSSYCESLNPANATEAAKPVIKELQRRIALIGTPSADLAGNRVRVLDTGATSGGTFGTGVSWDLLAPTTEEAKSDETNRTSLVIQWGITVGGHRNLVLLGGDADVEVWERIQKNIAAAYPGRVTWEAAITPHHASRYTLGRKNENDTFEYSSDAKKALSHQQGDGFLVSSSKKIVNNDDDPPSAQARDKYYEILAGSSNVSASDKERFLCTGSHKNGKPDHVTLHFTSGGVAKKRGGSIAPGIATGVGTGGSYGDTKEG